MCDMVGNGCNDDDNGDDDDTLVTSLTVFDSF